MLETLRWLSYSVIRYIMHIIIMCLYDIMKDQLYPLLLNVGLTVFNIHPRVTLAPPPLNVTHNQVSTSITGYHGIYFFVREMLPTQ